MVLASHAHHANQGKTATKPAIASAVPSSRHNRRAPHKGEVNASGVAGHRRSGGQACAQRNDGSISNAGRMKAQSSPVRRNANKRSTTLTGGHFVEKDKGSRACTTAQGARVKTSGLQSTSSSSPRGIYEASRTSSSSTAYSVCQPNLCEVPHRTSGIRGPLVSSVACEKAALVPALAKGQFGRAGMQAHASLRLDEKRELMQRQLSAACATRAGLENILAPYSKLPQN